jgi:hypothetical protein
MPGVICRGDIFHIERDVQALVTFLENRAYAAIAKRTDLERTIVPLRQQGIDSAVLNRQLETARQAEAQAIDLAADVALLARWLHDDVLAVAGPDHATRCELFDFLVAELRSRTTLCPHRLRPLARLLANQRGPLLAFAAALDQDLAALAGQFQLPVPTVRALFNVQALHPEDPARWASEPALRSQLGDRFFVLSEAVTQLAARTVRASSVVENLNSRLRNYFFLRRHLGSRYLELLQFFLNHRRFLRSERPERVGKSPAELLTGESHPHWLEMLGYHPFSRN